MAPRKKSFGGRPKRKPSPGERVHLGFRVTPDLKQHVERAADRSGRSISQEAEMRLERSFEREGLLSEALELAYGRRLAAILLMLGKAMKDTGEIVAFASTRTIEGKENWLDTPSAFDQAAKSAAHVLEALRPSGDATPPAFPHSEQLGVGFANAALEEGASGRSRIGEHQRALQIHDMLGDDLASRLKPFDHLTDASERKKGPRK